MQKNRILGSFRTGLIVLHLIYHTLFLFTGNIYVWRRRLIDRTHLYFVCKWPISSIKKVILKIVVCTEIKLSYTLNYPSIFAYSFNTHLMFKFIESVAILRCFVENIIMMLLFKKCLILLKDCFVFT